MKNFKEVTFGNEEVSIASLIKQLEELNSPMQYSVDEIIRGFLTCFAYLCDASAFKNNEAILGSIASAILMSFDSDAGKTFYTKGKKSIKLTAWEENSIKSSPVLSPHYYRIASVLNGQISRLRMLMAYEISKGGLGRQKMQIWIKHYQCFKDLRAVANDEQKTFINQILKFYSLLAYQTSESGVLRDEMGLMTKVGVNQSKGKGIFIVPDGIDKVVYFARKFENLFVIAGQYHVVHQNVYNYSIRTFSDKTNNLLRATYFILRDNLKKYDGVSGEAIIKEVLSVLVFQGEDAAWNAFNAKLELYPDMIPEWAIEKYCLLDVVGKNSRNPERIAEKVADSKKVVKVFQNNARKDAKLNELKRISLSELRRLAFNSENLLNEAKQQADFRKLLNAMGEKLEVILTDVEKRDHLVIFRKKYPDSPHVTMKREIKDIFSGDQSHRPRRITLYSFCLHLLYKDVITSKLDLESADRLARLSNCGLTSELALAINNYLIAIEKKAIELYLKKRIKSLPQDKAQVIVKDILLKL